MSLSVDEMKARFKVQLNEAIDKCQDTDPKCAFASGMLLILSALKIKDGQSISYQIAVMHSALREIGEDRGWGVASNG